MKLYIDRNHSSTSKYPSILSRLFVLASGFLAIVSSIVGWGAGHDATLSGQTASSLSPHESIELPVYNAAVSTDSLGAANSKAKAISTPMEFQGSPADVRIFLMWGQSHMAGSSRVGESISQNPLWASPPYPHLAGGVSVAV